MKWIIIGIVVIIVIAIVRSIFSSRCTACGKFFALVQIGKEQEKEEQISKLEQHDVKNKQGEVIGTTEQRVYGKRIYWLETYRCKYCQQLCYKYTSEEKY